MEKRKRIAIYGGTFDPVHVGHLAVANDLLKLFELDQVVFVPAYAAPHKRAVGVTPPLHRYTMLALATQDSDAVRVSTIELEEPQKPFTIETLLRLQKQFGDSVRLVFVMGADSWAEITTWREWEKVLSIVDHIVVARPGYELKTQSVPATIRERIVDLSGVPAAEISSRFEESEATKIYITDAIFVDVSATAIRRNFAAGDNEDWVTRVPPPVGEYIRKYGLYKKKNGSEFDD
jgi:nicotinate-nucleotide adenylyltransferase